MGFFYWGRFLVNRVSTQLDDLIKETVESLGYELWGSAFHSRGNEQTLSVFIDSPGGITLDDCSAVSRRLSQVLDEIDPIQGAYLLEVSSPGLDRPLFTVAQFEKYVGKQVRVEVKTSINGQRRFKGKLLSVTSKEIGIEDSRQFVTVQMNNIIKANLIPEV
ncbi:MAG: ribosome maturation factor RimP [Gammaproteobacteria bacterium]|nr:ribosome maturation factor RimP [Gammaproteobacteria bacterium]